MAKKQKHPEHVNHERWLISYADFITLLFAFFVVMFAISKVDANKVGRFQESFNLAVGVSESGKGYLPSDESGATPVESSAMPEQALESARLANEEASAGPAPEDKPRFPESLASLQRVLEEKKALEGALQGLKIVRRGNELVLRLDATALFDSGDDRVRPGSIAALDAIAGEVRDRDVQIRVEGHTDDVPISTLRFRSNWDLSTARATSVVTALVTRSRLRPERIAAIGYAEFQPIAPNDGADNRAKNRRVDFVLSVPVATPPEESTSTFL